ncbi:TPA: hypothetical protein ACQVH3_005100 [Serratia marcescens]
MRDNVQVHIQRLHANIFSMSIENESIGYLFVNDESEEKNERVVVVNTNGDNVGKYCCMRHATNAAAKAHFNLGDDYIVLENDSPIDLIKKLILASLLSEITRH